MPILSSVGALFRFASPDIFSTARENIVEDFKFHNFCIRLRRVSCASLLHNSVTLKFVHIRKPVFHQSKFQQMGDAPYAHWSQTLSFGAQNGMKVDVTVGNGK
jgi:hypothetical protein